MRICNKYREMFKIVLNESFVQSIIYNENHYHLVSCFNFGIKKRVNEIIRLTTN